MGEPVDALIDRLVRAARLPDTAAREELRRELQAHFEDAGGSPDAVARAVARFGDEMIVAEQFQRVYRWDYALLYAIKLAAAVLFSTAAALFLQVLVNLRLAVGAEVLRLAPGFAKGAVVSVAVVLTLAAAWEVGRPPFDRRRVADRRPRRLLAVFGAYAAVIYVTHVTARIEFGAVHAVLASAALLAVWTSTVTILSRCETVFLNIFEKD